MCVLPLQGVSFLTHSDHASGRWALAYALFNYLKWSLALVVFPRLCLIGFNYAQPFLISRAIEYVSEPVSSENKNDGYGLIAATALVYLGISVIPLTFLAILQYICLQ